MAPKKISKKKSKKLRKRNEECRHSYSMIMQTLKRFICSIRHVWAQGHDQSDACERVFGSFFFRHQPNGRLEANGRARVAIH
jgi:hypothetical protein